MSQNDSLETFGRGHPPGVVHLCGGILNAEIHVFLRSILTDHAKKKTFGDTIAKLAAALTASLAATSLVAQNAANAGQYVSANKRHRPSRNGYFLRDWPEEPATALFCGYASLKAQQSAFRS
jgi:hypothetical protein